MSSIATLVVPGSVEYVLYRSHYPPHRTRRLPRSVPLRMMLPPFTSPLVADPSRPIVRRVLEVVREVCRPVSRVPFREALGMTESDAWRSGPQALAVV